MAAQPQSTTTPIGPTLTLNQGGKTYTATPTANTTFGQQQAAITAGWSPVNTSNQPSSSGFNSSALPTLNQQSNNAANNSFGSFATNGQPQNNQPNNGQPQPQSGSNDIGSLFNSYYQTSAGLLKSVAGTMTDAAQNAYNTAVSNAALTRSQVELQKNSALAQINAQYSNDWINLGIQHQNAIGALASQMALADPFGAQSSSAASGSIGRVNDLYGQMATQLTNMYNAQQVQINNGAMNAALETQKQIQDAQATFQSQLANILGSVAQSQVQLGAQALGVAEFSYQRRQQALSLGATAANTFSLPAAQLQKAGLVSPIVNQFGVTTGYNLDNSLLKNLGMAVQNGTDSNEYRNLNPNQLQLLQTIMNDPAYQELVDGGMSPESAIQSVALGSYRNLSTQLEVSSQTNYAASVARNLGTGTAVGTGGIGGSPSFSTSYVSSTGGGMKPSPELNKEISDWNVATSDAAVSNLKTYVNKINDGAVSNFGNVFYNLIGRTGLDPASVLSKSAVGGVALQSFINANNAKGIMTSLSGLSQADQKTVLSEILNEVLAKGQSVVTTYGGGGYDLRGMGDVDSKNNTLTTMINNLGGSFSSAPQGGSSSPFSALGNTSWNDLFNPSWFSK